MAFISAPAARASIRLLAQKGAKEGGLSGIQKVVGPGGLTYIIAAISALMSGQKPPPPPPDRDPISRLVALLRAVDPLVRNPMARAVLCGFGLRRFLPKEDSTVEYIEKRFWEHPIVYSVVGLALLYAVLTNPQAILGAFSALPGLSFLKPTPLAPPVQPDTYGKLLADLDYYRDRASSYRDAAYAYTGMAAVATD